MSDARKQAGLRAYVAFWETLRPDTVDDLAAVTTPEVRFTDPFNDVTGRDAVAGVLRHMFGAVQDPRFKVLDQGFIGDSAVLRWRFTARVPVLGVWDVTGMSTLELDDNGRVARHTDYWDTGPVVWLRLPVIGRLLRRLARRLGAGRQW